MPFCALVKSQSPNNHQLCYSCGSWKCCLLCMGTLRQSRLLFIPLNTITMSHHSPWFLRVSRSFAQSTLSLFTSNSEVVGQDPFFSIWMGHLLPVLNFATGWQGQSDRYKGHSFRIGAASPAAECGYSETQIRLLGRWKSDAFKKYIRLPSLQSTPTCFSSPF